MHNSDDYERIAKAIKYIETNFRAQPNLDQIAESIHLSKYHFDRLFKRWAGISPIQFLQYITLDYTKQKLTESRSILDTSYDAGLSGPGRLHDLFVTFEAMTTGEYKSRGEGLKITYGTGPSPFGDCMIATTKRGICHLGFPEKSYRPHYRKQLHDNWPGAEFIEDNNRVTFPTYICYSMLIVTCSNSPSNKRYAAKSPSTDEKINQKASPHNFIPLRSSNEGSAGAG